MQNASKQIALGHRLCRSQLGDMNVPAFLILRLCTLGTTLEHDLGALQGAELAALAGSTAQTPLEVLLACLALHGRWPKCNLEVADEYPPICCEHLRSSEGPKVR